MLSTIVKLEILFQFQYILGSYHSEYVMLGFVNECLQTLFKHTKINNYSLKKVKYFDFQYIDYTYFYKYLLLIALKEYFGDTR